MHILTVSIYLMLLIGDGKISAATAISKTTRLKVDRVIAPVGFKLEREIITHEPTKTSVNLG